MERKKSDFTVASPPLFATGSFFLSFILAFAPLSSVPTSFTPRDAALSDISLPVGQSVGGPALGKQNRRAAMPVSGKAR